MDLCFRARKYFTEIPQQNFLHGSWPTGDQVSKMVLSFVSRSSKLTESEGKVRGVVISCQKHRRQPGLATSI